MNTNFKVIGLIRLGIKPEPTAPKADALTTRPSELLMPTIPFSLHLSSLLETKKESSFRLCNVMGSGCNCFLLQAKPSRGLIFVNANLNTVSMLLMQEQYFAVNVEHADSHKHVKTNGRSAVTAECDNDGYYALGSG